MQTREKSSAMFLVLAVGLFALAGCGGNGGTVTPTSTPSSAFYQTVTVADLNGDGMLDIAATFSISEGYNPFKSGWVSVYLQDQTNPGKFIGPTNYLAGDYSPGLAAGDLNEDGQVDLVTANYQPAQRGVTILLQDGAGSGHFLPGVDYAVAGSSSAVTVSDLNGDGIPDLAILGGGISILFQNPSAPGTFLPLTTINEGVGELTFVAADLNGDGKADLTFPSSGGISVLLQNPAAKGAFLGPMTYGPVLQLEGGMAVGDLNGDGRPDIAVTNMGRFDGDKTGTVQLYFQDPAAPGTFVGQTNFITGTSISGGSSAPVCIADLNADGKSDLAAGNPGVSLCGSGNCDHQGSAVSIFLQDPSSPGNFQPAVNYSTGKTDVKAMVIGDINADGKPDLVLAYHNGIVIRFQDPNVPGGFLAETYITK